MDPPSTHSVYGHRSGSRAGAPRAPAGARRPQRVDHLPHAACSARAARFFGRCVGSGVQGRRRGGRACVPSGLRGPQRWHLGLGARPLGADVAVPSLRLLSRSSLGAWHGPRVVPETGGARHVSLPGPFAVDRTSHGSVFRSPWDTATRRAAVAAGGRVHARCCAAASRCPATPLDFPPSHPESGEGPDGTCAAPPSGRRQ